MTSWNWLYLSDFAGFKPTFLPEDNPADFSFFFDTSSRRTCYLAPERFYKPGVDTEKQKQAENPEAIYTGLTDAMDIFSAGYFYILRYRSGEYDPTPYIEKIEDDHIKELIRHMIQLDPSKRFSAERYLADWRDKAFPKHFYTFLHQYIHSVTESMGVSSANSGLAASGDTQEPRPKTDADEKIERIYHDFDKISIFLGLEPPKPSDSISSGSGLMGLTHGMDSLVIHDKGSQDESEKHAPTDDIKLDRVVPYIVSCFTDEVGLVRAHAVKILTKLLSQVETLNVINVTIFPEYILPALRSFPSDPEVFVRATYAGCIAQLAQTALRYLELAQLLRNEGVIAGNEVDGDADGSPYEATYDSALFDLQVAIEDQIRMILIDHDSSVKRELLSDISSLCIFLGKQRVNDVLLSHMITYLNGRDWMLRSAFFESIVGVGAFVGGRSLEEYILPLTIQALTDSEEFVVEKVLKSLASLCDLGLFQKMAIWDLVSVVAPLLCHPSLWIRYGAIGFISSTARRLPMADIWCMIYPIIRPFLRSDIGEVSDLHLRENVKAPLSRAVFEQSIVWATKANRSSFWKPVRERPMPSRSISNSQNLAIPFTMQGSSSRDDSPIFVVVKSQEDEQYLEKLRSIGMTAEDEQKLAAMREYIWKLSRTRQSARPKGREGDPRDGSSRQRDGGEIKLRELGITPRTVFLSPAMVDRDYGSMRESVRSKKSSGGRSSKLRSIVKSNTTGNLPRISSDNTIFSSLGAGGGAGGGSGQRDASSVPGIYEQGPGHAPTASGSSSRGGAGSGGLGGNLYMQSDTQSTTSLASSIWPSSLPRGLSHGNASSFPASPESSARARGSGSKHTGSGASRRTRMLLTPGTNKSAESGKAAPATTSMDETTVQGTIELPATEKTVQDVIAGSGVPLPKASTLPWQIPLDDEPYSSLHLRENRGLEQYNARAYPFTPDGGQRNLAELFLHQALLAFQPPMSEFGPPINPLSRLRRLQRSNAQVMRNQWRPEGTLVAHLAEHKAAINQILVSPDHNFFVSCSDDGSLKIWDTARLEKNVTNRARMSYNLLGGKVTCMAFIENTHSVAAGSDNGNIHVFRVNVIEAGKYGKCETVRRIALEDEYPVIMEHYNAVFATNRGSIQGVDLSTTRLVWEVQNELSHGVITAMVIDPQKTWLLVGTNRGVLTLWDLRFKIALRSWVHPSKSRISRLVIHPEQHSHHRSGKVIIAAGKNEVSVWDIEHGECLEVFGVRNPDEKRTLSLDKFRPSEPLSGGELLRNSFTPNDTTHLATDQSIRAVLCSPEGDYMITAGADRKLRYWDTGKVEVSYVISGMELQEGRPKYSTRRVEGLTIHYELTDPPSATAQRAASGRSNLVTVQQQQLLRNHLDAIRDIALTELPCPMVISGDRDGVIKVFL
ncbi:Serine/threonine-protein kinase [Actinomortierella ambigua]|uniref:non-specific serine/threonine protein kinase n=1 Tax=Actinomortierella ambigua TaxID=1343610 RepID=A0A9P6U4F0_9FUNG|nr:Serine/threonine-protein kinase [Actinomortierella ambigua]